MGSIHPSLVGAKTFDDPVPFVRDPRKLIVALQYWSGDLAKAMQLARLIAEIEPQFNSRVEIAFVARFDCPHDMETIQSVGKKFKTHLLRGRRESIGWPTGCNDLALDLLQQAAWNKRHGDWKTHKAIYLLESDNVPMHRYWLQALSDEYDEAAGKGKLIMGSWSPYHTLWGHLNGNLIADLAIAEKIPQLDHCPPKAGWDVHISQFIHDRWHKSRQMQNHYDHRNNISEERLFSSVDGTTPVAVVHGVKDDSAMRQVRPRLFPGL